LRSGQLSRAKCELERDRVTRLAAIVATKRGRSAQGLGQVLAAGETEEFEDVTHR
jgi:hypothetical protein